MIAPLPAGEECKHTTHLPTTTTFSSSPSPTMGMWSHSTSPDLESSPYIAARPPPQHFYMPPQDTWFPWLMPMIFFADIALFVYTMYVNDCPSSIDDCVLEPQLGRFSFQPLKENPLLGPSTDTLLKMGGLQLKSVVDEGETWRLVSCMWLHGGVIHLISNMMSLLFIGIRLEQEFGFLRIGLLFVLSGVGGSLLSCTKLESTVSVGASGALFGLLGAMLSELITNWTIYANKCAALLTLILVIALNLSVGLIPKVDSSAHIGGFISGFLLGFVLLIRPQFGYVSRKHIPPGYDVKLMKPKYKCYQYLLWVTAFVILIIGYTVGLAKLLNPPLVDSLVQ